MFAQNVIKRYDRDLLKSDAQEIPLERIIELNYGINLMYLNLSNNNSILSVTIFDDCFTPIYCPESDEYINLFVKAGTIIIDESLLDEDYETTYRYVLASEIALWLFHQDFYIDEKLNKVTSETTKNIESQVDQLALSLLMPSSRIKTAYDKIKKVFKRTTTISLLSDIFNVSPQLLIQRLENLEIVKYLDTKIYIGGVNK